MYRIDGCAFSLRKLGDAGFFLMTWSLPACYLKSLRSVRYFLHEWSSFCMSCRLRSAYAIPSSSCMSCKFWSLEGCWLALVELPEVSSRPSRNARRTVESICLPWTPLGSGKEECISSWDILLDSSCLSLVFSSPMLGSLNGGVNK